MDTEQHEWKVRAIAIPAALVVAVGFHAWPLGHMLQRTFLSMIVHELGHAVTAWWCGFSALPGLWKTLIPETRGLVWVLVLALEVAIIAYGWRRAKLAIALAGLALALLQFAVTRAAVDDAQAWIIFGGDGGAMVIGTLLIMAFFVPRLAEHGLRWGLLVIGAAAFVDTFATWWAARTDPDVIPFGEIEGVGQSDPSKLQEVYGWSTAQLVHRYVVLGMICLGALAALYAWNVYLARRQNAASSETSPSTPT